MSFCNLKGNIPNELYNLNNLSHLDLSYNFFRKTKPFNF
ncbi:MAG: hypothetical protein IPL25_13030 [Saprospiraceae bacterium]|nr:hypothetical protein [Candidatus Vicinibacter affinis]